MKLIIALLLTVASLNSVLAQDKGDLVNEIDQLTKDIRTELYQSSVGTEALVEVRDNLQDILDLLKNNGSQSDTACFDFAYEKYNISFGATDSTNYAIAACKKIKDVKVAAFAYEKYNISFGATDSMNKARDAAAGDVKGKVSIIAFAYEKYNISFGATDSIKFAINKSYLVSKSSFACISKAYEKYNISFGATDSINKAFDVCKN